MTCARDDLKYPLRYAPRLQGYDYAQGNYYFVTICTYERQNLFGVVNGDQVILNESGETATQTWSMIPKLFSGVTCDLFVAMPNHIHSLLAFGDTCGSRAASTVSDQCVTLSRVINAYKSISSKEINRLRSAVGTKVCQRSFHDHVVRNDRDLDRIREYIDTNPLRWSLDENNPDSKRFSPAIRRRGS